MFDQKHVLHRDISFRNITIRVERDGHSGRRPGLLIDFDYAVTIPRVPASSDSVKVHRSVRHLLHSE
jgi:Ser/Thr protein kinase RdoA (MazF antagonist)